MVESKKLACKTIGHSNLDLMTFINLLKANDVNCLVDVRSAPYSRYTPHFNRQTLPADLKPEGITYVYLGNLLGGRYDDPKVLHPDGRVDYKKVEQLPGFQVGLKRLLVILEEGRQIALMCSEDNPLSCHRFLLVSRALSKQNIVIQHITADGNVLRQKALEEELLKMYKKQCSNQSLDKFFAGKVKSTTDDRERLLDKAYELRSKEVAYKANEVINEGFE
jgi:uncharacterized protein (DUF488 family)